MTAEVLLNAQYQIKKACDNLGLERDVCEFLKEPERFIEVSIPVKMDDGSTKIFKGYRSQHNDAIGPYKGGIRFNEKVEADEIKALSIWMTFKAGIAGIPFGGAKGGISVNPNALSKNELEQLSRGYIRKIYKYIGKNIDIPAPDVGTNGQIMTWMMDEYSMLTGEQTPAVITGKPVEVGGSLGRNAATGFGVVEVAKKYLEKINKNPKESTAAIQGFGNVGSFTGKFLFESGIKTIAVAEHDESGEFAIYNENGIDIPKLMQFKETNKNFKEFDGVQIISIEDFWSLNVDILIPAALENAIDEKTAHMINAKVILEGANGPVTKSGNNILEEKNVFVVPDILANAGGVTASYFEWVQNNYGYYWSEKEVLEKAAKSMQKSFENIWNLMENYENISMRDAAYMYSIKKVYDAMKLRGRI